LLGYPPKDLTVNQENDLKSISELGFKSGDIIRIEQKDVIQSKGPQIAKTQVTRNSLPTGPVTSLSSTTTNEKENKDKKTLVLYRRKIEDDNSCLFNAVGYVLDKRNLSLASELRQVVAAVIVSKPENYNAAMLNGKSVSEYAEYIQKSDKWGGDIELDILADYFQSEIAACDTESKNIYIFGQGKGFKSRSYLVYSGIHYDALVANESKNGETISADVTVFASDDKMVYQKAKEFLDIANKKKEFTNLQTFTLKCGDCGLPLVGREGAVEHAKITNHTNFVEYR